MRKFLALTISIAISGYAATAVLDVGGAQPTANNESSLQALSAPWPEDISRSKLINAALFEAFVYFNLQNNAKESSRIYIDSAVGEENAMWIESLGRESINLYSSYLDDSFALVVGLEGKFLNNTINENSLRGFEDTICEHIAEEKYVAGCGVEHLAWVGYGPTVDTGELGVSESLPSIIPHEIFHSVQAYLYPDSGKMSNMGDANYWFLEGTAEFFGYATLDYLGVSEYSVSTQEPWYYLPSPHDGLESHQDAPQSFNSPPEHYWMGQIATEYIVASAGVEGILNIWKNLGQGMSEEEAFKNAIGLSLSEFYVKFDKAYSSIYLNNTDIATFENISYCPDVWDCSGETTMASPDQGWDWKSEYSGPLDLPELAENINHELNHEPTTAGAQELQGCKDINNMREFRNGIAIDSKRSGGGVTVSTQWYVYFASLDTNLDGIVCGSGD